MDRILENRKFDIALASLIGIALAVLLSFFFYININHYTAAMESDVASDALLTTVLYDNNFIQPDTWCASAEICVISAPNLAAFIYPLVGKNMNLSMGIACNIFALLLVAVMFIYFRKMSFSYTESLLPVLLLFALCTSMLEAEKMVILYAAYYVSHYITLFLILIAHNYFLKNKKVNIPIYILTMALAFVNGLQGMHGILFCYAPVIGVECIRQLVSIIKNKKLSYMSISVWTVVLGGVSYYATKLNSSFNMSTSTDFSNAPFKFINEIWPLLKELSGFVRAPLITTLFLIATILGYGLACKKLIGSNDDEYDHLWGTFAPIISLCICVLSNAVTDNIASPRYYTMLLFVMGIGTMLFMHDFKAVITSATLVFAIIISVIAMRSLYFSTIVGDSHEERREYLAGQWMIENGYEYGYSTFDHANYITAMANNRVKVRAVSDMKEMKGLAWLTDITWYPPIKSTEGPTCYIVSPFMAEDFEEFLANNNPTILEVGEAGNYTIYVLDHDYSVWK